LGAIARVNEGFCSQGMCVFVAKKYGNAAALGVSADGQVAVVWFVVFYPRWRVLFANIAAMLYFNEPMHSG